MPLPVSLSTGDQIYKYRLMKRIGGGSFGEVWLAHDVTLKKDFAVKFLDPSRATIGDPLKEAQVGHRARHANLATVHYADVVVHAGTSLVAIVMDYYPKGCVLSQICAGNFVPVRTAIAQIIDVLRGLEYLHELGTLHNDIKPQNILIGEHDQGILTDYGISEVTAGAPSAKPSMSYKLHKAPEVITTNEIAAATDVYQVGLTAFRLINGVGCIREKWNALGQVEYQKRVVAGDLITCKDYLPFVPNGIRRIIEKAVAADPAGRFQSALEMRRALEKLNLKGSWTLDATGTYHGEDPGCTYRFVAEPMKNGKNKFTALKKHRKSGHEVQCSKYSKSELLTRDIEKCKSKFMAAVVEGKL